MELPKREIKYLPVSSLKPAPKNPKRHPKNQIDMLIKSINKFGFTNPILISQDNIIIGGHARWQASKKIGLSEVPTIFIDLPPAEAQAYILTDNRLAELAETDDNIIAEMLKDTQEIPNFDIEVTGYTNDDYTQLLNEIEKHDKKFKPGFTPGTDSKPVFNTNAETVFVADDTALEIFNNRSTICCCYSGGKDSSFALIWAKMNFPDKRIVAIFSDTGVEFPGMVSHIHRVCKHLEVECKIVKPDIDVFEYWERRGRFFNMIFPECQSILIYKPINEYLLTFDAKDTVIIDGSRGDQVRRMTTKSKTSGSCDKCMEAYSYYHPCYDVDYELEKKLVFGSGIPIWEGYGQGFKRSACWCCPGQNGEQAYALQQNYPGLANYIRRWEQKLGMPIKGPGGMNFDHLVHSGEVKAKKRALAESEGKVYTDIDEEKWGAFSEDLPEGWTPD
jgi:3'-phosphoadenosine 5'-phosphosulfate sulfotransferase (PAPS reductase)/FAD synthetase